MPVRPSIPTLLLALLLTPAALAQPTPAAPATPTPNLVSLWLLDAENGRPIPNLKPLIYSESGGKSLPINPVGDLYTIDITAHTSLTLGDITDATPAATNFSPCYLPNNLAFDIKQIQSTGIAPQNKCSKRTHAAAPGELVIFLRKTHWWELWQKNIN